MDKGVIRKVMGDKIWLHFAALGLERTHRYQLVDKGVIRKVMGDKIWPHFAALG